MARLSSQTGVLHTQVTGTGVPPDQPQTNQEGGNFRAQSPKELLIEQAYNHGHFTQAALCGGGTIGWSPSDVVKHCAKAGSVVESFKKAAIEAGMSKDEVADIWSTHSLRGASDCKNFLAQAKSEADRETRETQRKLQEELSRKLQAQAAKDNQRRERLSARQREIRASGKVRLGAGKKGSKKPLAR